MRNFKIKVTPEQSEVIQKLLFIAGYTWWNGNTDVFISPHDSSFLYIYDTKKIRYGINNEIFLNHHNIEVTFDEFINEIEIELNKNKKV